MVSLVAILGTFHAFFAAIWLGMAAYQILVFAPAARAEPEAGPQVAKRMLVQGWMMRLFSSVAGLTVLLGLWLYAEVQVWEFDQGSSYAMALNLGVLLGIAAFLVAMFVTAPTARKLRDLEPGPEAAEVAGRLQRRMGMGGTAILVLLTVTFLLMQLAPAL